MKTTLVIALLGLLVACSVPTSAAGNSLKHRFLRAVESNKCELVCDGDIASGDSVIYKYQGYYLLVITGEGQSFFTIINIERNLIISLNLEAKRVALISIKNKGAFIFETDTGKYVYLNLKFDVEIDFSAKSIDYRKLHDLIVSLNSQVVGAVVKKNNIFISISKYIIQGSIEVAFDVSVEVAAEIRVGFGGVLDHLKSKGVKISIDIITEIGVYCSPNDDLTEVINFIMIRLAPALNINYIEKLKLAVKSGAEALKTFAANIRGAVTSLGETVVSNFRQWTITVKENLSYIVTAALSVNGRWAITFVPVGLETGALEIGVISNFMFFYHKDGEWVTLIYKNLIGHFNMKTGSGVVIKGDFCATVERNSAIESKWSVFMKERSVVNLQAGLEATRDVMANTKIGFSLRYSTFDKNMKNGVSASFSAEFYADFEFYRNYLIETNSDSGMTVCFKGHFLDGFKNSIGKIVLWALPKLILGVDFLSSLLIKAIMATKNIALGIEFDFSISIGR